MPTLTRRRVAAACVLMLGTLFLGLGILRDSWAMSIFGLGLFLAALVGFSYLLIHRVNRVIGLSETTHSGLESLEAGQRKTIWLQRKSVEQLSDLSKQLKELRETYESGSKGQAEALDHLMTNAAEWPEECFNQLSVFRSQFSEFVASVAEWVALAEAGAKEGVANLQAQSASTIDGAMGRVIRRFDGVDRLLDSLHTVAERMPVEVAATTEQLKSISKAFDAAEERVLERDVLFENLVNRIDSVDCRLASIAERDTGADLAHAVSRAVQATLSESRTSEQASMLESLQHQLSVLNDAVAAMQQTSSRLSGIAAADSEQLKEISTVVTKILPAQRAEIARAKVESVKEVEAIIQLQSYLAPNGPMPLLGGWAMEPVSMLGVVNELIARKPRLVLECGSGTSTLWIARTLKRLGAGRVVSLEHLKEHHAATSRALLAAELDEYVDLCFAPLRTHRIGKEQFKWYDLRRVNLCDRSVDLLLIDGPPQGTGPLARYPALPLLEPVLADHALVVLDDAHRPDEVEETRRWVAEYQGLQEFGELGERTKMFIYSTTAGISNQRGSAHLQAM